MQHPIRFFNKHLLNRLTSQFARVPLGPFAVIHHIGRRSGKSYNTPIMVAPIDNGFAIALTYGPEVDWYRNVLASGRYGLLWHGKEYTLAPPELLDVNAALPAFPIPLRVILMLLGTQDFVRTTLSGD
ncbi:MAG: nitroreductase family deazaflavin-dependent oxidoreductase [Chloroflexota bacterium]